MVGAGPDQSQGPGTQSSIRAITAASLSAHQQETGVRSGASIQIPHLHPFPFSPLAQNLEPDLSLEVPLSRVSPPARLQWTEGTVGSGAGSVSTPPLTNGDSGETPARYFSHKIVRLCYGNTMIPSNFQPKSTQLQERALPSSRMPAGSETQHLISNFLTF